MNATDRIGGELMDSRDIAEAITELEAELEDGPLDDEDQEKLDALRKLDEEAPSGDWVYGSTLIREDYFQTYAQELAEDIGAIDRDASWPLGHIDWESAANALLIDYTDVEFMGATYYVR